MSTNIVGFIKGLLPSFNKSDIESDLEASLESIPTIQDVYTSIESVQKASDFGSHVAKELIKDLYKDLALAKPKLDINRNNIGSAILSLIANIKVNGDYIAKEISDAINDTIVSQALTAYKANLLRCVPHYSFITRYSLDLANYLYLLEIENSDSGSLDKDYKLNKKQIEFITKNLWLYARLLALYGQPEKVFKDKLDNISDITLPKDNIDEAVDFYDLDKVDLVNNLPAGFVGSPIYTVRLIFATWEADRFHALRDKKKLLELRYLHLKLLKEQGGNDSGLEKEIEHLQRRVTDIDYKLSKIEESTE